MIEFHPFGEPLQLKEAEKRLGMDTIVKSYLICDGIGKKMEQVFSLLRPERSKGKGVLLSGGCGSGKTHSLLFLSAIAGDRRYLKYLRDGELAEQALGIAGRFEVLLLDVAQESRALREIVFQAVQQDLEKRGLHFTYPEEEDRTFDLQALQSIPDFLLSEPVRRGYLIVVDGLTEYLERRRGPAFQSDLIFLKALGSAVKSSALRMVFGVQDRLFSQRRLTAAAKKMTGKTSGLIHISIDDDDLAELICARCLQKNQKQRDLVQRHLGNFLDCYPQMAQQFERYLDFFPLHPGAVAQLAELYTARRQGILRSLSGLIAWGLEQEFDRSHPGLLAVDSSWEDLKDKIKNSSDNRDRNIVTASEELEQAATHLFEGPYQSFALRMIRGLSIRKMDACETGVDRGMSAEELRDSLCLYLPHQLKQDADGLRVLIEQTLEKMIADGKKRLIETDESGRRYHLNLKKKTSYNHKITLEDISQNIGISRTTIYKIVNNKGYVSDRTRTLVEEALEKYNYVPNYNARDLAHHKNYKIAYIGMAHHGSTYFSKLTQTGIQKALAEMADNGLEVISAISPVSQPEQQVRDIEHLLQEGIRNFVIVPCVPEVLEEEVRKLRSLHCNIIYLSRYVKERERIFVGIDYPKSGRLAAEMMSKIMPGGGNIAIMVGNRLEDDLWVRQRYDGFVQYLAPKKEFNIICIKDQITTDSSAGIACEEVLKQYPQVNAIYDVSYKSDVIARKLVEMRREQEIKLIGFDLYDAVIPYIKASVVDVIIGQSLSNQAYDAIKMLFYHICYGTPIKNGDYNARLDVIVSSNMDCFDY